MSDSSPALTVKSKLSLNKDTLSRLTPTELLQVKGGTLPVWTIIPPAIAMGYLEWTVLKLGYYTVTSSFCRSNGDPLPLPPKRQG